MSRACVQPTTPAKQQRISMLPSSLAISTVAVSTPVAFVISTIFRTILDEGKSIRRRSMAATDCLRLMSNSARPARPCSSRARAASRAKVPAPPVTARVLAQQRIWPENEGPRVEPQWSNKTRHTYSVSMNSEPCGGSSCGTKIRWNRWWSAGH